MKSKTTKQTLSQRKHISIRLRPSGFLGRFDVLLRSKKIVSYSPEPIYEAARVLRASGYADNVQLTARHAGHDDDSISMPIGQFIRLRLETRGKLLEQLGSR